MKKAIAVIIALCMVFGLAACGNTNSGNVSVINDVPIPKPREGYALSSVAVPTSVQYPNEEEFNKGGNYDNEAAQKAYSEWGDQRQEKIELAKVYSGKLDHYLQLSAEYLKDLDGKNAVCSSINIYFALAMLAECTEGNSRAQILDVLGAADITELRTVAKALWEQTYYEGWNYTTVLASSIWMNNCILGMTPEYDNDTLATLALYYYATAYTGNALDLGFSRAFKDWLNEHTGGLLKDHIEDIDDFTEDLVVAIATTVYFKASWNTQFEPSMTSDDVFHSVSGDTTKPFMHLTESADICAGEGFTAVFMPFAAAGGMWVILPDEGVTPEQLNADGKLFGLTSAFAVLYDDNAEKDDSMEFSYGKVAVSLPRFDVDAKLDLIPILQRMGITDVFSSAVSDFSGIIKNIDQVFVSEATHAARVKIDEEGCEAAAFTVIITKTQGMFIDEPLEFKVDRPFAFVITGSDGLPLFTGIVNDPN